MEAEELTSLEREVFAEMASLNGTEPELIYKTCIRNNATYKFHYYAAARR